ncbi:hypothetical protein QC763_302720 [Podospora pseudopauciseta]|uniref:Uncharacterized protein n=1 Tax=Podospora pseudopauciseta TaxID=2093780 RepID=A0ABR0HFD3_9PEZI|nr:hypothetical protein QC763_302720 [Podospora pseudopauciseta]
MYAIIELLRARALADHKTRIPIDRLDAEHRRHLVRAINNVLSIELALFTYAQIIDSLPTGDVAWEVRSPLLQGEHPLATEHEELCPGAMEKAREVCPKWDTEMLRFSPQVLNAYREAAPGSKLFANRLIEMVAVAIHEFVVLLYQLNFCVHKGGREVVDAIAKWKETSKPELYSWMTDEEWCPPDPICTVFHSIQYLDHDIYPQGVADVVGYWAEDRILGGVVVFERRAEECDGHNSNYSNPHPPNIYLSPSRAKVTIRVTQLRNEQQQKLVDFLLLKDASKAAESSPLPILVDKKNLKRFKLESSIVKYGIFRDIWERKPLDREALRYLNRRPGSELDDPWAFGLMVITNIGVKRRLEDEEPGIAEAYKKVKLEVESREDSETQDGKGKENDDAGKGLDSKEEEGGSRDKVTEVVQSDEKNKKRKIATKRAKKRKSEDG